MDYDESAIPSTYARARHLSQAALEPWLSAVAENVGTRRVSICLDLGCGTGRFSAALGERLNCLVIASDPSVRMVTQLTSGGSRRVVRLAASAERMPLATGAVELVFLSMVFHHLDPAEAMPELRRVTAERGSVFVRNSMKEGLSGVPYLRFFPEARELASAFLPATGALLRHFSSVGFGLRAKGVIEQELCGSWAEYCDRIALRALSDLASISDDAFHRGVKAMRAEPGPEGQPVVEAIEYFVFS